MQDRKHKPVDFRASGDPVKVNRARIGRPEGWVEEVKWYLWTGE